MPAPRNIFVKNPERCFEQAEYRKCRNSGHRIHARATSSLRVPAVRIFRCVEFISDKIDVLEGSI